MGGINVGACEPLSFNLNLNPDYAYCVDFELCDWWDPAGISLSGYFFSNGGGSPDSDTSQAEQQAAETESGQVEYGSTDLSQAVQAQRLTDNNMENTYAAGRLDDGSTIVGRSSAGRHAEEDVIAQAGGRRITDIYSEFEPCANKCEALTKGMTVTWSWAWNGVNRTASQAARAAAIRELFGR